MIGTARPQMLSGQRCQPEWESSFRKFEIAGHFVKSGRANGYRLHKGKRLHKNSYAYVHNIKHFC